VGDRVRPTTAHAPTRAVDAVGVEEPADLVEALVAAHGGALRSFAFRLAGNPQRADDIVQETLLRAWRHPEALDGSRGSPRAWLFTVARRIAADQWRREVNRRTTEAKAAAEGSRVSGLPDQWDRMVDESIVLAALDELTEAHREILIQTVWLGRSVAEAAEQVGIPVGTVKSRSYYALRALRHSLDEMGFFT